MLNSPIVIDRAIYITEAQQTVTESLIDNPDTDRPVDGQEVITVTSEGTTVTLTIVTTIGETLYDYEQWSIDTKGNVTETVTPFDLM